MATLKRLRTAQRSLTFDVEFVLCALQMEFLAASPVSGTALDTFLRDEDTDSQAIQFLFADIPHTSFREPAKVLRMSHWNGGVKS